MPEPKPKKLVDFEPAKPSGKINFINFGTEGEPFIIHIEDWDVFEIPALKEEWRKTIYILDIDRRGIRINSMGFQELLKPFWGKKSSLVVRRNIPRDDQGNLIPSATKYRLNQLNEASLWSYEPISE